MDRIKRTPVEAAEMAVLARSARLDLAPERAAPLAEAVTGIFMLLDALDAVPLGETAPAFAYRAKWEG